MAASAPSTKIMPNADLTSLCESVRDALAESGVFGAISMLPSRLTCAAANSAEPAEYRLFAEDGKLWVSLVTANRWLSESIESDLMHTGDKMEELLDEELAELDYEGETPTIEHFRSVDKLYTFRSALPIAAGSWKSPSAIATAVLFMRGYEACFRRLGDMDAGSEEE